MTVANIARPALVHCSKLLEYVTMGYSSLQGIVAISGD